MGAQAGMPVFRALQQARMSPAPLALTRYLQLGSDAAQIVEQNFHIAQRCPVVHDAAAQTEPAAQSRIGKVGTAIPLQCQQQAFIVGVELLLDFFSFGWAGRGQCTLQARRQMPETKDRELDWREHFEVFAVLHQRFEVTSAGEIFFNCFTECLKSDAFQQHPNFERAKTP
jgi:hypothetical protein